MSTNYDWTNLDWEAWRKRMGYTHLDAAQVVGRSERQVKYYERGFQTISGEAVPVIIPITVVKAAMFDEMQRNSGG